MGFSVRQSGQSVERAVLLRPGVGNSSLQTAAEVLSWQGLQVDAVFLGDVPRRSNERCFHYLNESFHMFMAHNPEIVIGGDDWHKLWCVQETVRAFAAAAGLYILVLGELGHQCPWVVARELRWLGTDSRLKH